MIYTSDNKKIQKIVKHLRAYNVKGFNGHTSNGICWYLSKKKGLNNIEICSMIGTILPSDIIYISPGEAGYTDLRAKIAPMLADYFETDFSYDLVTGKMKHSDEGKRIRRRIYYAIKGK